jgi:hypothetical protein
MKKRYFQFVLIAGLMSSVLSFSALKQEPCIQLLSNDDRGCSVEFRVQNFSLDSFQVGRKVYQKPDFDEALTEGIPGEPMIPYGIIVLGVPPEGDVNVVLSQSEPPIQKEGILVCPIPKLIKVEGLSEEFYFEGPAYKKQEFLPGRLFELESPEWFGPHRIIRIKVFPVQYNSSTGQVLIHSRIRLIAHFAYYGKRILKTQNRSDETVYREALLNYSTARKWRAQQQVPEKQLSKIYQTGELYKIPVATDGIYQITGSFLKSHGIDIGSIDPSTLKIFNNGGVKLPQKLTDPRPNGLIENPILVFGIEDRRFDESDYLLFYGKGASGWSYHLIDNRLSHYVNPYTETNVYWLSFNDGKLGMRMERQPVFEAANQEPSSFFTDRIFIEHDVDNPLRGGMFWYSYAFDVKNSDVSLDIPFRDPVESNTVLFWMNFKGEDTDDASYVTHTFSASFNGQSLVLSSSRIINSGEASPRTNYSGEILPNGNTLNIHYSSNTLSGKAYLGWIEMEYSRKLLARDGELRFYSPVAVGPFQYRLSDFGVEPLVLDVSDPASIRIVPLVPANGSYLLTDSSNSFIPKTYYAKEGTDYLTPNSIEKKQVSDLRNTANAGELLIISHRDFYEQALRYKSFKETDDSMTVYLADVQDVYDEFSGGLLDPAAIRDFVKYAFDHWRIPPVYLLLFGDGDYDYRNIRSTADKNWIPPFERDELQKLNARATDDWYTYVSGDDNKMDLSVGRLTVQSAEEAKSVVDKLTQYQVNPLWGDWRSLITIVADDEIGTSTDETYHVEGSETLAERIIPHLFNLRKIYLTEYPVEIRMRRLKPKAEDDLVAQINQGTLIVNFMGHGNSSLWAHEYVFNQPTDFNRLQNGDRQPLFYAATCEFGLYDDPYEQHFAEKLLASQEKGGIAIIGATRFCDAARNMSLNQAFMRSLLLKSDNQYRIGDAMRLAKLSTGYTDNNEKYQILGDPSMRLAVPRYRSVFTKMEPDTFKALDLVHVQGEVLQNGSVWNEFNGRLVLKAVDSKKFTSYKTDVGSILNYILPGNSMFNGESKVESGRFDAHFIVPKDISYGGFLGRLSGYFWNEAVDGFGYRDSIYTGGSVLIEDHQGPDIRLTFSQRENFISGDMISGEPELAAILEDTKSGINLTGEIGHKITLAVDDRPPEDVSGFFQYDQGSYLKGKILYKLSGIGQGPHQLAVKAWDNANNSSSQTIEFRVVPAEKLVLENVFNYPNPMSDDTDFTFEISQSADVEIKIFTVDGRLIQHIDRVWVQPGFNMVHWHGKDAEGDGVPNGVYLYKVIARNRIGGKEIETSAIGKLIVMQ